ncbi:LysR family transcriptional regulator [Microvirga makkahensis]|uniref:LysR family transcriptional regulator n=1 Tax=Microvirga makkahensis TaxID=1128670 RepID=A0A7X3MWA5_9HYPH|nr:LysR family transcriptional regulator [Microvirga makkahensis]MXQ14379.1 LysR family transcriptional regulator [Microvirga makkahensis]
MTKPYLPLNALRAFEASARHLSFTRAGLELRVTQAAISHQVKGLEAMLGVSLFRRLPRGLALTDEGLVLMPVLTEAFERISATLDRLEHGQIEEVVTVGCNSTFANGWLLQHLDEFRARHPLIDLRLLINNNRVDVAGDGLDLALRFGNGLWHGTEAVHLLSAPLSPVCAPATAKRLRHPSDLARETLLRSYRVEEWPLWFEMTATPCSTIRGPIFDSSVTMAEAAAQGLGVALVPVCMFQRDLAAERLVQPFGVEVSAGSYWLTWLKSKPLTPGMEAFRDWLMLKLGCDRGS